MKAQWRRWSALFSARAAREKAILALAALALVYAGLDIAWLSPAFKDWRAARQALADKHADLARLSALLTQLAERTRADEAQTQAALAAGRRDLGGLAGQLAVFERTLVPARRMPEFLQGLLPGRGVEVVGLKSLPPTPLIARPAEKPGEVRAAGGETGAAANLYKHGVEIRLAGTYAALLEYLDRLEKSPQKVLFGRMELRAEKYPRSELSLTLYTLSLDRSWLIV